MNKAESIASSIIHPIGAFNSGFKETGLPVQVSMYSLEWVGLVYFTLGDHAKLLHTNVTTIMFSADKTQKCKNLLVKRVLGAIFRFSSKTFYIRTTRDSKREKIVAHKNNIY